MPYCTPDDVRNRHKLLTIDDFPDDYVQTYINTAQTRINNQMAPHYVVPFPDPVPSVINTICADMAAQLLCEFHFSDINYRENTPLAEVYRKRAEAELDFTIDHATIDGMPGVEKRQPDAPEMRKRIATTTPTQSPTKERLQRFEWAIQSPLANVRKWP